MGGACMELEHYEVASKIFRKIESHSNSGTKAVAGINEAIMLMKKGAEEDAFVLLEEIKEKHH